MIKTVSKEIADKMHSLGIVIESDFCRDKFVEGEDVFPNIGAPFEIPAPTACELLEAMPIGTSLEKWNDSEHVAGHRLSIAVYGGINPADALGKLAIWLKENGYWIGK